VQVSTGGGEQPTWSADGRLFYRMAHRIGSGGTQFVAWVNWLDE
jgi:hypothetical protein